MAKNNASGWRAQDDITASYIAQRNAEARSKGGTVSTPVLDNAVRERYVKNNTDAGWRAQDDITASYMAALNAANRNMASNGKNAEKEEKEETKAFAPASSLEEFMGILPMPEKKNDGLDGTHVAQIVRDEWANYGVDNAYDYRPQAEWAGRGLRSGVVGAARDIVNYLGNTVQQGSRAFSAQSYAESNALADLYNGTAGGKTYEELYEQYAKEYQDNTEQKPLQKTVDWGEEYDAETERLAQELNVSDAAREQYQFNQAVGRMAPAIAVSATGNLAGGGMMLLGAGEAAKYAYTIGRVLSSAATFTSAAGGAYEDAKAHGIDDDKAMTYATTVGAIELATESIFSGLGKIGGKSIGTGGVTEDFVSSLAKKVSSDQLVQNAIIYAGGVLGEGFEEWLSEWGDYAANRLLVKYDDRTLKDVWGDSKESFMQGAMMSSLLNITQLMQRGVPPKEAIRQGVDETAAEAGISPNPEANTTQQNTASESAQTNTEAQTVISPAAQTMANILQRPVNRSQANKIINNPEMRAAYEAYTGETLPGVKSEAAKSVMEYSRNNADLTPIAQVVLGQQTEQSPAVNTVLGQQVEQSAPQTNADTISPAAQAMAKAVQVNEQQSVPQNSDVQGTPLYTPQQISQANEAYGKATEVQNVQNGDGIPRFPSTPIEPNAPAKVSDTVTTVRDSIATPEDVKQLINDSIEDGGYHYFPITNDATVESAAARIRENGYDSVLRDWTAAVRNGQTGAELAVTGQLLYDAAVKGGDTKLALDILSDYQTLGTNTAQGLQAMRLIMQNLSPESKLYMVSKTVKNMYDSLSDKAKAKLPDGIKLNEQLVNDYIHAPDGESEAAAYKALCKGIAKQIPSTALEKWNALRYLNMLGNLRTQGRNLAGNTGMALTAATKNTIRYGMERILEFVSGGKYQRSTSLVVSPEMLSAAKADYDTYSDFINGDAKYNDTVNANKLQKDIQSERTIIQSKVPGLKQLAKVGEAARKATNWAMEKGDTIFIKQQYARYLSGFLEARGMDGDTFAKIVSGELTPSVEQQKIIDDGRNFAAKEAQEATFHDKNKFSDWVTKIGRGKDTPWAVRVAAEGLSPFRKTPANVAVRAYEYSPAGFLDTTIKAVQAAKGKNGVSGADVVNSLSKSLTGTALFGLGVLLRQAGWIRAEEDDEKKAAFEKMQGAQDYSLVLPNGTSVTIDWLSPMAIPMFMGALLNDAADEDGFAVSDVFDILTKLSAPMLEMSMLQGVNDALDSIKYADNNLEAIAINLAMSYLMQGLTNTFLGQVERTFEDRRYSTFVSGEDNQTEKAIHRQFSKASAKTPGLDYNQVEYIDAWGRPEYSGSAFSRAFENFLSPGYISRQNSTEVDNELMRLYDSGQTNVLPERIGMSEKVNVYDSKGKQVEERYLTKDEYVQFQKVMGQTSLEMVKDLMNSPLYSSMSDEAKAEAISDIYGYAKDMARMTVEPSSKNALKTDVSKLSNPSAYYGAVASFSTAVKDSDNRNYKEIDSLTTTLGKLPKDVQAAVLENKPEIGKLIDARENGYTASQYYTIKDSVSSLTPAAGYTNVATWQKIMEICSMNIPDDQKDYFTDNYFEGKVHDKYMSAREKGYSPYSVALAYETANTVKGVDANGDGKIDRGSTKAAFIQAMMGYGASKHSAEYLWKLFG